MAVKFYQEQNQVPLEMHKVRMIQKLSLLPVEERLKKIQQQYHQKMLKALPAKVVMKCLYFAEHFDRKKLREASSRQVRRNVKRR